MNKAQLIVKLAARKVNLFRDVHAKDRTPFRFLLFSCMRLIAFLFPDSWRPAFLAPSNQSLGPALGVCLRQSLGPFLGVCLHRQA